MSKCKKCKFQGKLTGGHRAMVSCDYIGHKLTRRPCPPGDACTVFEPKKKGEQYVIRPGDCIFAPRLEREELCDPQ